jgi:hypothetical protein
LDTPNLSIKNKSAKNKNKKEFTIDVKLIKNFKYSSIFNSEEKDRNPKLLSEKLKFSKKHQILGNNLKLTKKFEK